MVGMLEKGRDPIYTLGSHLELVVPSALVAVARLAVSRLAGRVLAVGRRSALLLATVSLVLDPDPREGTEGLLVGGQEVNSSLRRDRGLLGRWAVVEEVTEHILAESFVFLGEEDEAMPDLVDDARTHRQATVLKCNQDQVLAELLDRLVDGLLLDPAFVQGLLTDEAKVVLLDPANP